MKKFARTVLSVCICAVIAVLFVAFNDQWQVASPASTVRMRPPFEDVQQEDETPMATVSPTPVATATPSKKKLPWSLILVNGETPIDPAYSFIPAFYDTETIDSRILESVTHLLNDARDAGLSLWIASSYRDIETQSIILENATQNRMVDYGMTQEEAQQDALKTIALPSYSEHHTGLAVDFNDVSSSFEETPEYTWLCKNAAAYGFVQRYPKDKVSITEIDAEPWHYRYVGVEHAREMQRQNLCLEEYTITMLGE